MTLNCFYMAYESNDENCAQCCGPFDTALEAEQESQRLGWRWVAVYSYSVDASGDIQSHDKRFYTLSNSVLLIAPMTEEEQRFFAKYEQQFAEAAIKTWGKNFLQKILNALLSLCVEWRYSESHHYHDYD